MSAPPPIDFTGRTLLLTGASGGIGRAIAALFGSLNAHLMLTDRDLGALEACAAALPGSTSVAIAAADVTRPTEVAAAFAHAIERFGGIDFLVTGAGIFVGQSVADMSEAEWRQTLSINLDGVFHACHEAANVLRDGGAIVNISSIAGHRGSHHRAHYAASKAGVLGLTRSLAYELAPRGIRVNAVSPGLIDTGMVRPLLQERGAGIIDNAPLKRLGRPEEVATVVAFLCSEWASFITGESVHVNGGMYMAG